MAEIALWLVTHVYGFCFFLFSVVKGLFIRYCPEHIILKIFCFYADRDVKSHIMASNMTINERIALVHLLADTKAKSKQFNDTFVKDLGNLTIGYKQTIDKLIKEGKVPPNLYPSSFNPRNHVLIIASSQLFPPLPRRHL